MASTLKNWKSYDSTTATSNDKANALVPVPVQYCTAASSWSSYKSGLPVQLHSCNQGFLNPLL